MTSQQHIYANTFILTVLLFLLLHPIAAQRLNLTVILDTFPVPDNGAEIYLTGNFNNWNPGDTAYLLKKDSAGKRTVIVQNLVPDVYELKFTQRRWNNVQTKTDGSSVENYIVKLQSDSTVRLSVASWQDYFTAPEKLHTVSGNVKIIDTAFKIPQLNRTRRIWIYLPPGYSRARNRERYPVIYMHDGQNLFDDYTSVAGEWGIDEALDSLIENGLPPSIIVGIDYSEKRMNEYNPYYFERVGEGEGEEYLDFIVNSLKPFIDKRYRTRPQRNSTLIAGSSMGGLISFYALLKHSAVFGKAGVFSPAFWTAPAIKPLTGSLMTEFNARIFFFMGGLEGASYISDLEEVADLIGKKSTALVYALIDPEGRHNEATWRKWFPEFYKWILSDGFNSQIE